MKTGMRIVLSAIMAVGLWGVNVVWGENVSPQIANAAVVASVNGDATDATAARSFIQNKDKVQSFAGIMFLLGMVLVWAAPVKNAMKAPFVNKAVPLIMLCFMAASMTGCVRPFDTPEYVEIEPSQTAFVIPLEEGAKDQAKFNSESYFETKKVAMKRIQIPHRWNQTGRWSHQGEWIDTVRVIIVDRSPVTREWQAEDDSTKTKGKDMAIWIESSDSVGFSMGWSCSAYIKEDDASKFLYWYPSGALAIVMDGEIRARIQQTAAEVAAKYPLDSLREKKLEVAIAVKGDIQPFFAERGITITTIGMFGGMTYENPSIQTAIDATFISQQEKVNAAAMLAAQKDKNARIEQEAEALAKAAETKAGGEARGLELINTALAKAANNPQLVELRQLEVEAKRVEKWTGTYPNFVSGEGANVWVGLGKDVASPSGGASQAK